MAWKDEKSHFGTHAQMKKSVQEKNIAKDMNIKDEDEHLYFFPVSSPLESSDLNPVQLYDYNEDNYLDGHELRAAFYSEQEQADKKKPLLSDVEKLVDDVLKSDDADNDGKISWDEFLASFKDD